MPKPQVFKDERGKNYVMGANGKRLFLAPVEVVNGKLTRTDRSGDSSFLTNKEWDAETGTYKSSLNKTSIASIAALAAIGAPAAAAAVGGAGGAATVGGTTTMHAVPPAVTAAGTGASTVGFWSPTTLKLLELGIGTGTNIYGNRAAANADRERGAREDRSAAEALAFLKRQDELDRAQYNEERSRLWGQQDVDRTRTEEDRQRSIGAWNAREARLAPLRGGSGAFATLNDLVGLRPSSGDGRAPAGPPPVRASDWDGTYAAGPGQRIDDERRATAVDDDHMYTMPDGRKVPYIPFVNPYERGPMQDNYSGDERPQFRTQPIGRRPPPTLAELANYSGMRA